MTAYRDTHFRELDGFVQHLQLAEALRIDDTQIGWFSMWDQLASARQIAADHGRDMRSYDTARTRAHTTAFRSPVGMSKAREAADEAIDALHAAFPEVVVPGPRRRGPRSRQPLLEVTRTKASESPMRMHCVTLRAPSKRSFWGREKAPVGQFPHRCVCCSVATEGECSYRPGSDRHHHAPSIRIPCCRECEGHVRLDTDLPALARFGIAGLGATIVGIALREALGVLGGIFALILWGFLQMRARQLSRHLDLDGHHPSFSVSMHPDHFVLLTSNAVLADEFELRNRLVEL